jgi:hypothetical protein
MLMTKEESRSARRQVSYTGFLGKGITTSERLENEANRVLYHEFPASNSPKWGN